MDTNGTLIHGEFKRWLLDNKQFVYAGLSLDGTPETHNKNRSNSYSKIDIDFFLKNYPDQSVRMTINRETIANLSNDIIHLHNLGFKEVIATFAHGIKWEVEKIRDILEIELAKLCNFYLENPTLKECSIFEMNLIDILNQEGKVKKWCGTGTSMVSIGIDGTKYPCHTFQPGTTDDEKAIKLGEIDFDSIDAFGDPECINCIIEPICPNCYGMNYVKNGNIFTRDKELCEIVKIRAVATSFLLGQQLERGIKTISPSDLYKTIKSIKKIQNNFVN